MDLDHEHVEALVAIVFTTVFGVHLTRAVAGWSVQLGPYNLPTWASWVALLLAGSLAFHFWGRVWNTDL